MLYAALGVATITSHTASSKVPLADLLPSGFGRAGRTPTAVLAVALTMGTMNVYACSVAKLAAALAQEGTLPAWFGGAGQRSVPRRPLLALGVLAAVFLGRLAAGATSASELIRASSACFVVVSDVLALASAVRLLAGPLRAAAALSLALVCVVALFSSAYLAVPAGAALLVLGVRSANARRSVEKTPQPRFVASTSSGGSGPVCSNAISVRSVRQAR